MNLNNVNNTTKDWLYYLSMIDASYEPLDLLFSSENIPYRKINRIRNREKTMNNAHRILPQECFTSS